MFGLHRGRSGWESEGWCTSSRRLCSTLVGRALRDRHYYVYAESDDTVWDGEKDNDGAEFCVKEGGVIKLNDETLKNDDDSLDCEKHGFVAKKFMHVDTNDYTEFTFDIED